MAINWKSDTGLVSVPPNDGVDFVTEGQEIDVHATEISIIITRGGSPVKCHIHGLNRYVKNCTHGKEN